jgi:hypothetical protein
MVVVAGAYFLYLGAPRWFEKEPDPGSQESLARIAAGINRSVPVMIDQTGSQQIRDWGKRTVEAGRLQPARNSG